MLRRRTTTMTLPEYIGWFASIVIFGWSLGCLTCGRVDFAACGTVAGLAFFGGPALCGRKLRDEPKRKGGR